MSLKYSISKQFNTVNNESPQKRHVILPKYLKKRKIELLRKKIILRKYAYMFYRKSVSKVLVSTTLKYYKKHLLKRMFNVLKMYWYEQCIEWRLLIRSNIHYKWVLKRKVFHYWQSYLIVQKQIAIKTATANLHYKWKLKIRYFYKLKVARKYNLLFQHFESQLSSYAIYLFMNINLLRLAVDYFNTIINYFVFKLYYKARLKMYFTKLRLYAKSSIKKVNQALLIKSFRKLKYRPENIKTYFISWHNFTQLSIIKTLKCEIAAQFQENKLRHTYFYHLYTYRKSQQIKRRNITVAETFYFTTLKHKILKVWIEYQEYKNARYDQINKVYQFYEQVLKRRSFRTLLNHKHKKQACRKMIFDINIRINQRLLFQYFQRIKKYYHYKKANVIKYNLACNFHNNLLLKSIFKIMKIYVENQKLELEKRRCFIVRNIEMRTLKSFLEKLKNYRNHKNEKLLKISHANKNYTTNLLRKAFKKWIIFVNNNKNLLKKYYTLNNRYCNVIIRRAFSLWKSFINEEKRIKALLINAKDLYYKSLIQENKKYIPITGMDEELSIALKYFKIWKIKTNFCKTFKYQENYFKRTCYSSNKPNTEDFLKKFNWNPLCFEMPRIPTYLKISNN